MYVYICIHVSSVYMRTRMHARMHVCIHTMSYIYTHVGMYIYMYTYTYLFIYKHMWVCVCAYIIYICVHTSARAPNSATASIAGAQECRWPFEVPYAEDRNYHSDHQSLSSAESCYSEIAIRVSSGSNGHCCDHYKSPTAAASNKDAGSHCITKP